MQKGEKACHCIQALMVVIVYVLLTLFIANPICSGPLSNTHRMGMGGALPPSGHFNPAGFFEQRCYLFFSFDHADYYGIPGLSSDGIGASLHSKNYQVTMRLSMFGFERFEEERLSAYTGSAFSKKRWILGLKYDLTGLSSSGFGKSYENAISAELSIVPNRFIEIGIRSILFGCGADGESEGFLASLNLRRVHIVYNVYRNIYSGSDTRMGFRYDYSETAIFESGFRVASNEIFVGASIIIEQVWISVSVSDHPYLGSSIYLGVGWLRCLDSL